MQKNIWKILTIILGCLMILGVFVWIYLTPYLAIWNMKNAVENRDAETFCAYIDFPILRENLKAEMNAKTLVNQEKLKDNPFAGIATAFVPSIINNMIDAFVTPQAIEAAFKKQNILPQKDNPANVLNPDFLKNNEIEYGYYSINDFRVSSNDKVKGKTQFIFKRIGIWSWKLVEIKLADV